MTSPSDDLAEAIRVAVEDTLAKHGGGMVRAYVMALDYFDADGAPSWATATANRQTPMETLGLLRWHTLSVEGDVAAYFQGDEDR